MQYNEMSTEQKKSFNNLILLVGVIVIVIGSIIVNSLSAESQIENVIHKNFTSAKVDEYNDDYLVVKVRAYVTDEERLINLRNVFSDLSKMELKNSILVINFYNEDWSEITRTVSIGMNDLYNTDWSKNMTFEEFKKEINY